MEEDVDFVRFMIGWQKSEVGDFFALKIFPCTKSAKTAPLIWHGLFGSLVPSTPKRKNKTFTSYPRLELSYSLVS